MGEYRKPSTGEIERAIADRREDLVASVRELEVTVRNRLDWRARVRQRPITFVGGAFVVGLILAMR